MVEGATGPRRRDQWLPAPGPESWRTLTDTILVMGHEYQDRVSLEIHRIFAAGLPTRPEWMAMARENLGRWMERNADSPGLMRCYREWLGILDSRTVDEVCEILTARTDNGQRLRQNTPFVGMLTPSEVWEIKSHLRKAMEGAIAG